MKNSSTEKKRLRKILKDKIAAMPEEKAAEESIRITEILTELPQWKNSRNILSFFSMKGKEIDTSFMINRGWDEGKTIAFPRMHGDTIRFHIVEREQIHGLEHHPYGIVEPPSGFPEFIPSEDNRALLIAPGLGFTADGKRLGRGKGYYDRYLEKYGKYLDIVAVAFSCQITDSLPEEETDRRVPVIVTPEGIIRVQDSGTTRT